MQILSSRHNRRRSKRARQIIAVFVILAVAGGWLAYAPALSRYKSWKQQHALTQARAFLKAKDFPNAKLALDVAFAAVPGDAEALRVAADLLDNVGVPDAMQLRRRLVQLAPDSAEDRAALVMTSLRFHDLNAARDALSDMTPAQASQPVALKAALTYAMATANKPIADALYDRLKVLEPGNQNLEIMQSVLRLQSPTDAVAAKAKSELEALARDPKNALYIHRELLVNAMVRRDAAEAKQLTALIVADPASTFTDRLNAASLSLGAEERPFAEVFASVAPLAGGNAADAVAFTHWLLALGKTKDADQWLGTLTPAVAAEPAVVEARTEVVSALEDWDRLMPLLEAGAWGTVNPKTIQLAYAARLVATRKNEALQAQIWDEALASAGKALPELILLNRLAVSWKWDAQEQRTLWAIARTNPSQTWANQALFNRYRARAETENILSLLSMMRELDPSVARYKYDWALLSLLVRPAPGWAAPKATMEELYREEPDNAAYATGYAYALALSDRGGEALAVVEKLSPEARALPARAPYLAFIYGTNRRKAEFETAAALLPQALQLLPEERALVEAGRDALNKPLPKKAPPMAAKKTEMPAADSGVKN